MPQVQDVKKDIPFVFLGGTCAGPDYRKQLIPQLTGNYFDPVVENWTPDDAERENDAKAMAALNVFVLTPAATGWYSIAEMTELALVSHKPVVIAFIEVDGFTWTDHQLKSNAQICNLLTRHGALIAKDLDAVAKIVNLRLG